MPVFSDVCTVTGGSYSVLQELLYKQWKDGSFYFLMWKKHHRWQPQYVTKYTNTGFGKNWTGPVGVPLHSLSNISKSTLGKMEVFWGGEELDRAKFI